MQLCHPRARLHSYPILQTQTLSLSLKKFGVAGGGLSQSFRTMILQKAPSLSRLGISPLTQHPILLACLILVAQRLGHGWPNVGLVPAPSHSMRRLPLVPQQLQT